MKHVKKYLTMTAVVFLITSGILVAHLGSTASAPKAETAFPDDMTVLNENIAYCLSEGTQGRITVDVKQAKQYSCLVETENRVYKFVDIPQGQHTFLLSEGNGEYSITFAEKIKGSQYRVLERVAVSVTDWDDADLYVHPSYMVEYEAESAFTKEAGKLRGDTSEETIRNVAEWVYENIRYNDLRRIWIEETGKGLSENIPDPEMTFQRRNGICLDMAALTAAMLRSLGIPSRLVFGYLDGQYHSWVLAESAEDTWVIVDSTIRFAGQSDRYQPEKYY